MELFKLLGTIAIENTDAVKALKETSAEGEKTQSKLSGAVEKIGGAVAKVGKVVAAGVGAASTAMGAMTTLAVKSYADYEQLVGGVETLFGAGGKSLAEYAESVGKKQYEVYHEFNDLIEAQNTVLRNADAAFKDAGLSANEYMETVTSFSAALIQSLDGDTNKAAEAANQAIIDMADNANKMGTSMESIQSAYQGFAKQNYTMLDNLKLGYGGTATEMARLINDSGVLGDAMIDLSDKQNIGAALSEVGFAKMVEAIHVVQTEMGITGTTAMEASKTISGSVTAMKSAWQNFLVGLADGNQNMDTLVSNLFDSVATVGANLIPRVEQTLKSIWKVVKKNAPKILAEIPTMVMNLLPQSVKDIMMEAHDYLCDTVVFGLEAVWESVKNLASAFKPLVDAVKSFIAPLKDANVQQNINIKIASLLETALYKIADVINIVASVVNTVFTFISEHKKLVESMVIVIGSFAAAFVLVTGAVTTFTKTLAIVKATITGVSAVIAAITSPIGIAVAAIGALIAIGVLLYKNWDEIKAKAVELFKNIKTTFENIKFVVSEIMTVIWSNAISAWENIKISITSKLTSISSAVSSKLTEIVSTVKQKFSDALSNATTIFTNIKTTISNKIEEAKKSVSTGFENIKNTISEKANSAKDTVSTVFENIKNSISNKINSAKEAVKNAIDKIKGYFDFEWNLPKLKLPHIYIKGEWDLKEGKFPSFGVEWYAKGGVLNQPTAFGINGNNLMVGGEAGPEAVAPIDVLQKYIAEAVAAQNAGLVDVLQKILAAILSNNEEMKDKFMEALEEMRFDINNREFARLVKAVN